MIGSRVLKASAIITAVTIAWLTTGRAQAQCGGVRFVPVTNQPGNSKLNLSYNYHLTVNLQYTIRMGSYPMPYRPPTLPYRPPVMNYPQPVMYYPQLVATPYPTMASLPPQTQPSVLLSTGQSVSRPMVAKTDEDKAAAPLVRLRFIEVTVGSVPSDASADRLRAALSKLPGSRGATVKRKADGQALVKVWYSENEPLSENTVLDAVERFGLSAVRG